MGDKDERLTRAEAHIFSTGIPDGGTQLCRANMKYGLAKIHWVQEQFGLKPDATFISTPDMTITRNAARWQSGFGYGGKISWGDGSVILWAGPYDSGEEVTFEHSWCSVCFPGGGEFTICVWAKDVHDAISEVGTLEVNIESSKRLSKIYPLFLRFLERFLERFPILQSLLGFFNGKYLHYIEAL